jgi:hypothetical protein
MRMISHVAVAALLATGATALTTVPAFAQKKGKEAAAAGPQLKLTDEVRKAASAAQTALAAKDTATALTQLQTAEPAAKTDDDRYIISALRLQAMATSTSDQTTMIPILDQLIANPKTPTTDLPRYTYFRGALAFQQKKYQEALPFLTRARDLGYQDPNLQLQIAQSQVSTGNVGGGVGEIEKSIEADIAAGKKPPEDVYNYAIAQLYKSGDRAGTAQWLQRLVKAYPTPQNWRKVLVIYRDGAEKTKPLDRGQKLDLYRLMRAAKALADQTDYLEYADLAYQGGLPYETKAVIDEGKATGKLPAANGTATRLTTDANNAIKIDTPLATLEKNARSGANGKSAAGTADVFYAQGNYARAIELYNLALQKGGVDASEVNLRLGAAYAQSGQKDQAKAAFAKVTGAPRSDIAGFWQQYLDLGSAGTAAVAAQ